MPDIATANLTVTIDGRTSEVAPGTTILETARQMGISIPTLCHYQGLEPYSACRVCLVEVETPRGPQYVPSCRNTVEDGLSVRTDTQGVLDLRRTILELLLAQAPDAEELAAFAAELGVTSTPFTPKPEGDCILCGLCTRVCRDRMGRGAVGFTGRGTAREVLPAFDEKTEQCQACGACVFVCPTGPIDLGAITARRTEGHVTNYDQFLTSRPNIDLAHPQAAPRVPSIDRENCYVPAAPRDRSRTGALGDVQPLVCRGTALRGDRDRDERTRREARTQPVAGGASGRRVWPVGPVSPVRPTRSVQSVRFAQPVAAGASRWTHALARAATRCSATRRSRMIVADRKTVPEIRDQIQDHDRVLLVGCGTCVTVCLAGGEREVGILGSAVRMSLKLAGRDNVVVDECTIERQCEDAFIDGLAPRVADYDAICWLRCGAGVQALAERFPHTAVYPGLNTQFIGILESHGVGTEKCMGCRACRLGEFAGICPLTRCAKRLLNGPRGGSRGGECEIREGLDCAWQLVHDRASALGIQERFDAIDPVQDWSTSLDGAPPQGLARRPAHCRPGSPRLASSSGFSPSASPSMARLHDSVLAPQRSLRTRCIDGRFFSVIPCLSLRSLP